MVNTPTLTKDPDKLAKIIKTHATREEERSSFWRLMCRVAYDYLQGARNFRFNRLDPNSLQSWPLDAEGNIEYQSQEMLAAIDRISGRLASADLAPLVERVGNSLQSIRERASGQLILDALINPNQLDGVKTQFAHIFTCLGMCGIAGHLVEHPTVGLSGDLEVVHPMQLLPFPSLGYDYTKQSGFIRQQWLPVSFLLEHEVYGKKVKKNREKMEIWKHSPGEVTEGDDPLELPLTAVRKPGEAEGDYVESAFVRELWLDGDAGTCSRYVLASGDYVIDDQDFTHKAAYASVGIARFMETGSFYGAGAFHLFWSINRELEHLLKSLFNNIRDIDKYGILVLPQGTVNHQAMARDVGRGLRVTYYEPDAYGENFRPFVIEPYNARDIPGRVAQFAKDLMGQLSPVQDLIQEKGRVDSAIGLNILDEQITRAMTTPSRGIRQAFGACYRGLVARTADLVASSEYERTFPVSRVTLDLAGAVIDFRNNKVSFSENPLPNVTRLGFTVKETAPRSTVARKAEALQLVELLQIDPDTFTLFALEEGLDFAFWFGDRKAAYESVVMDLLTLFSDGASPGEVVATPAMLLPEFQKRVYDAFMASRAVRLASPEVVNALQDYGEFLLEAMRLVLPNAMPNPDDAALLRSLETQRAQLAAVQQQATQASPIS